MTQDIFTFQYVSIKTDFQYTIDGENLNLHSNMFLLRPALLSCPLSELTFTFQYVSIKTACPWGIV